MSWFVEDMDFGEGRRSQGVGPATAPLPQGSLGVLPPLEPYVDPMDDPDDPANMSETVVGPWPIRQSVGSVLWEGLTFGLFGGEADTATSMEGTGGGVTEPTQPSRAFTAPTDGEVAKEPWFSYTLAPLRFVINNIRLPLLGAFEIILQPAKAWRVRYRSLFYASLPTLDSAEPGGQINFAKVEWREAVEAYGPRIRPPTQCNVCLGYTRLGSRPSAWRSGVNLGSVCGCKVREYLVSHEVALVSPLPPAVFAKPVGLRPATRDTYLWSLPGLEGVPARCPHHAVEPEGEPNVHGPMAVVGTSDGLGYIPRPLAHRGNLRAGGARCVICYGSGGHGFAPEIRRICKMPPIQNVPPLWWKHMWSTILRWREFCVDLPLDKPVGVTAVSPARLGVFEAPVITPCVIVVTSPAVHKALEEQRDGRDWRFFFVPTLRGERLMASWRFVLIASCDSPIDFRVLNAFSTVRERASMFYLSRVPYPVASGAPGHVVPFYAGACKLRGGFMNVDLRLMLASFYFCGDIYGWDEVFPSMYFDPIIVCLGDAVAPGVAAPSIDYGWAGERVRMAVLEGFRVPSFCYVGIDSREFYSLVKRHQDKVYDNTRLTFWHIWSDPRPTWDEESWMAKYYKEVFWDEYNGSMHDPLWGAGKHVAQELAFASGGILVMTFGTAGDIIPMRALARHLARYALPVTLIKLNTPAEGKVLLDASMGTVHASAVRIYNRARSFILSNATDATLAPHTLAPLPGSLYSFAPPPDVVEPMVIGDNIFVSFFHTCLGWFSDEPIHVGAYRRPGWLPRSADGFKFLELQRNTGRFEVGSTWGSDAKPAQGWEHVRVIEGSDHPTLFREYKTVICHGGAGTVQTAASAGARVVAATSALDRRYRNMYDAGVGVTPGGDPDNVFLALGRGDTRWVAFWLRAHLFKPWKLVSWYGVARPLMGLFRVMILGLLYHRANARSVLSTSPLVTLFLVLYSRMPTPALLAAFYAASKVLDRLLEIWNVSYYRVAVGFASVNWAMSASPLGLWVAQSSSIFAGLAATLAIKFIEYPVYKILQALANSLVGYEVPAGQEPVFLEYSPRFAWAPVMHTALVCPSLNQRYEGSDVGMGLYAFEVKEGGVSSPILIPTHLRWSDVVNAPTAVGRYSLAWNCQTGILINLSDHLTELGFGAVVMAGTAALSASIYSLAVVGAGVVVAVLRYIPMAVGVVPVEAAEVMFARQLLLKFYVRLTSSNTHVALSLLEWWRALMMPLAGAGDRTYADFCERVKAFQQKPLLWRASHEQVSRLNRELDEFAMMGLPRSVMDIIMSDISAAFDMSTELHREVQLARVALKVEIMASVEYQLWFDEPTQEHWAYVAGRFYAQAPPEMVQELLNFEEVNRLAPTRMWAPITQEVREGLSDCYRELLRRLANQPDAVLRRSSVDEWVDGCANLNPAVRLLSAYILLTPDWAPQAVIDAELKCDTLTANWVVTGYRLWLKHAPLGGDYGRWRVAALNAISQTESRLIPGFVSLFPAHDPRVVEEISGVGYEDVAEFAGELLAAQFVSEAPEVGRFNIVDDSEASLMFMAPYIGHAALATMAIHVEPVDMGVRKWLWQVFMDMGPAALGTLESVSNFLAVVRRWAEEFHVPVGPVTALINMITIAAQGIYDILDKVLDSIVMLLVSIWDTAAAPVTEYAYLGRAFFSLALPQARRRPKAVWALLFANDFQRLTPAERFALSCNIMAEPEPMSDYATWAQRVADEINRTGIADQVLIPGEPYRPLRLPRDPAVVSEEMAYLAPLMPSHVRPQHDIEAHVRRWVDQGTPRGMDGSWFAEPSRVAASINRYNVDRPEPDDATRLLVIEAADALADQFPSMYQNAKYMTPAAAARKVKVKYSPGLPFIPDFRDRKELQRHGFMAAMVKVAENRLREGIHPGTMAHAFIKSDVVDLNKLLAGKNLRSVISNDIPAAKTMLPATLEATRRPPPPDAFILNSLPRSEGGIRPFYERLRSRPYVLQADAQQFDSQLAPVITVDGLVHLRGRGYDGTLYQPIVKSQIRACYIAMKQASMVDLTTGTVFTRTGGLMTGQANTAVDNRDSFRLIIIAGWAGVTGRPASSFWEYNDLGNAGDDDAIGSEDNYQVWENIFTFIRERFGIMVVLEQTGWENLDLIGLEITPTLQHSHFYYTKVGVPIPTWSVRSQEQRLLLKKTEFRFRMAGLKDIALCMARADTHIGTALLTAHHEKFYAEFAEMYHDDMRPILLRFFKSYEVVQQRDSSGALVAFHLAPGEPRERYNAEAIAAIKFWLKAHRYPTYDKIMSVWLKPYSETTSSVARNHKKLLGWNPSISGLERVTWGLIQAREMLYTWVPRHVAGALPEFAGEDVTYIMRNQDYVVAKFVWLSLYHVGASPKVPTTSVFRTAMRENPYASAEDVNGFLGWLQVAGNLEELAGASLENHRGRMLTVTLAYIFVETIFKSMSRVYGLSILVHLYALSTRDVNRLYSLLNHVYMLATGRSSPVISNMMPADPYAWIKQFACIVAAAIPLRFQWYPGLKAVTAVVPTLVEWWAAADATAMPNVLRRVYTLIDVPALWMDIGASLVRIFARPISTSVLVVAPTGTGKSTAFLGLLVRNLCVPGRIWLACPTRVARDNYENPFLVRDLVQVLTRGVKIYSGTKICVLTYGHLVSRLLARDVATHDVVVYDEMHLGAVDQVIAWYLGSHLRRIMITATPNRRVMPVADEVLYYAGEKRFSVNKIVMEFEFAALWQSLVAAKPHLLKRALIVEPTLSRVHAVQRTLDRLSYVSHELSSDRPVAAPSGIVVATTIVDTAVTIKPDPTVLIDSGYSMRVMVDPESGRWLKTKAEIVPSSPSVALQRLGRVGRGGVSVAYVHPRAGTGSEPPPTVTPMLLARAPPDIFPHLLNHYGVKIPFDVVNSTAEGLFRYLAIDPGNFVLHSPHSLGLAIWIFVHQSNALPVDKVQALFYDHRLGHYDEEFELDIVEEIRRVSSVDPLLGSWDEAIGLLEAGLMGVMIGGVMHPATGLWVLSSFILPIGMRPEALGVLAPRVISLPLNVLSPGTTSTPREDVISWARSYPGGPSMFWGANLLELVPIDDEPPSRQFGCSDARPLLLALDAKWLQLSGRANWSGLAKVVLLTQLFEPLDLSSPVVRLLWNGLNSPLLGEFGLDISDLDLGTAMTSAALGLLVALVLPDRTTLWVDIVASIPTQVPKALRSGLVHLVDPVEQAVLGQVIHAGFARTAGLPVLGLLPTLDYSRAVTQLPWSAVYHPWAQAPLPVPGVAKHYNISDGQLVPLH
jgi:hypothetical protein